MNGVDIMELTKITSKGQITLPIEIRKALSLKDGDKVAFVENNGQYIVANPTMIAFEKARKALDSEVKKPGVNTGDKPHLKFIGTLSKESFDEINVALMDTQRVDVHEW